MKWNDAFRRILAELETRVETLVSPMRETRRPIVVPYRGYGSRRKVWIRGRVIDDPLIAPSGESRPLLGHTREMWRRFASHEIVGARVAISLGSTTVETTTDGEGYFDLELELEAELVSGSIWHEYSVRLIEPTPPGDGEAFEGSVLVPAEQARVGIISDIDDTVIDSSAADRLKMLRTLLFTAAESRMPFEGISELFHEILRNEAGQHPVFYVSSSPWNLYDFLVAVMDAHDLPRGPLLLQDFGFEENKLLHAPHDEHKLAQISRIVATYPELRWILVGDSGQRDPEIYAAVAEELPDNVRAIVIRDVTSPQRDAEVRRVLEPVEAGGVPVALVQTALEARALMERAEILGVRPSGIR